METQLYFLLTEQQRESMRFFFEEFVEYESYLDSLLPPGGEHYDFKLLFRAARECLEYLGFKCNTIRVTSPIRENEILEH